VRLAFFEMTKLRAFGLKFVMLETKTAAQSFKDNFKISVLCNFMICINFEGGIISVLKKDSEK